MDWWVYEPFLIEEENILGHSLKWLTVTTAPFEKIEFCTIPWEIDTHIKWNKTYCAF